MCGGHAWGHWARACVCILSFGRMSLSWCSARPPRAHVCPLRSALRWALGVWGKDPETPSDCAHGPQRRRPIQRTVASAAAAWPASSAACVSVAGLTNGFGGVRGEPELDGTPSRKATPRRRCASESSICSSSSPLCDARYVPPSPRGPWHPQGRGARGRAEVNWKREAAARDSARTCDPAVPCAPSAPPGGWPSAPGALRSRARWARPAPAGGATGLGASDRCACPCSFSAPRCGRGKPALVRRHTLEDRSELISCIESGNYAKAARIAAGESRRRLPPCPGLSEVVLRGVGARGRRGVTVLPCGHRPWG